MGDLLVQWRWRRCTHACVAATGLHYLLQPRAKFGLLRALFAWRDTAFGPQHASQGVHSPDRLQFVAMRCWRNWTGYAAKRVIWNKYLFQYRRTEMRRTLTPLMRRWRTFAMDQIAAREAGYSYSAWCTKKAAEEERKEEGEEEWSARLQQAAVRF